MTEDFPLRVGLVLGLVAVGVGLGAVGTALGVDDPVTDDGPTAEVHVSEDDVTLRRGDSDHAIVENVTVVGPVEVRATNGGIDVDTERVLSTADRERARRIARSNATVRGYLDELGDAELVVEPIYGTSAGSAERVNLSGDADGTGADVVVVNDTGEGTFRVENFTVTRDGGSVTVTRQNVVEDQVYVWIRRAGERTVLYEVQVDLAEGEVVVVSERTPFQD